MALSHRLHAWFLFYIRLFKNVTPSVRPSAGLGWFFNRYVLFHYESNPVISFLFGVELVMDKGAFLVATLCFYHRYPYLLA